MNFRRLRGIAAVAFTTIAAALLAGCMNSMAGSVDGGASRGVATLHFSATGIPEEYAKEFDAYNDRLNARSILPNDPFDITADEPGLVFVLEGTSAGDTYGPQEVVLVPPASGTGGYDFMLPGTPTTPVAMDAKLWTLTLTAYKTDSGSYDTDKPVLRGRTIVDLRNGSGTATIKMGIGGLITPASVTVSGMIVDPDNLASYAVAGIYKKIGLEDVGGTTAPTEQKITTLGTDDVNGVNLDAVPASTTKKSFEFTANDKEVSPGKYLFIINFYNASKVIVGTYTDTIVINPGNALNQVIETPIYMGTLPSAPTDVMASVIKDDGDTYLLKVEWKEATDVTNYELNLSTFDDDDKNGDDDYQDDINTYFDHTPAETDRTNANYSNFDNGRITNGQVYGVSFMSNDDEDVIDFVTAEDIIGDESSPMMYGDSSCVLRLKTGKVYEIQLRARNFLGASNWVDRVNSVASITPDTAIYRYKASDDQRINRMYVEYNLNGGKMTLSTEANPYSGNYYVDYWSWTANASLIEEGTTDKEHGLTCFSSFVSKSGTDFDAWKLTKGSAIATADSKETSTSDTTVKAYTYKNAKVIASFGNKLSGNVTQEDMMKDIVRSDVDFNVYKADGTTPVGIDADATSGISKLEKLSDGKNNILKIQVKKAFETGDFSSTNLYTNVRAEAWVGNYATDPVKTLEMDAVYGVFNLSTAGYDPGAILNIMVIADTKTLKDASQTFQFVIR